MQKLKFLILVIVVFSARVLTAQITITGKVLEESTGESLPFATIKILSTNKGTTTNVDGFFTLFNVPTDTSTIVVNYVGYEQLSIKLNPEFIKSRIVAKLNPITSTLEEVVVSADAYKVLKANDGISQATLSAKQLSTLPSIGEVDIFRSLQLLPGISATNENSSGLFVRGGTPEQNLVLLDGMTVYKVDHFFGFFSAFNAKAVKDVKIFKGAFPAKYGGRLSSVVDMTGKAGSFEKTSGSLGFNLFAFNGFLETPINKKVSILLAGRRSFSGVINSGIFQGLRDNLLGDNEFSNVDQTDNVLVNEVNPEFYFYDWNGKISYRPSDNDIITFSIYNGQDFLDESRDLRATIPVSSDEDQDRLLFIDIEEETNWGNTGISGKWSRQWNSKLYTNLLFAQSTYFSKYNRDAGLFVSIPAEDSVLFGGRAKTFEDNKVKDISARIDLEYQTNDKHSLEFGVAYNNTKIDYTNIRNDSITILDRHPSADYWSAYISDSWRPNDKLNIQAGLRYSYYNLTDQYLFSPRLLGSYNLTSKIKLKAGYGRFYQFASRIINENLSEGSRDFWLLADGNLVNLSSSDHYITGVSYELDGWLFDVEAYYKKLQNLSEFTLRFRRSDNFNPSELFFEGNGIARGLEFLIQKKSGNYTGWVSYTLGRVQNTFEKFNNGNSFPALHDQRHEIKFVQSIDINRWTLASTFIYGSGKPFSEPTGRYSIELLDGRDVSFIGVGEKNGSRISPYSRMDISAHYKVTHGKAKLDFGFSIFNLYNRINTWYFQYDFQQDPAVITEVKYIGITPNISFNIEF